MPTRKSKNVAEKKRTGRIPAGRGQGVATRVRRGTSRRDRRSSPRIEALKAPRQERSRQMVASILQASAEIFAQEGYARATTNKIAERAGVSVGSLYQYFPNKDSLLAALLAQHHEAVHRVVGAAIERLADPGVPLEEGLRALLTELLALHEANPALTRALSATVLRESPAAEKMHEEDDAQSRSVVAVLERRRDVRPGDRAAMAMVLGQTTAHLTRWIVHDAPPAMRQAAVEEVVELLVRFLRAD